MPARAALFLAAVLVGSGGTAMADSPIQAAPSASPALHVVPDTLRLPADGADDAPSIRRAIDTLCAGSGGTTAGGTVQLLARHYTVNSPITVSACVVQILGQGWQEHAEGGAPLGGTWLNIGAPFMGGGTSPITFTGPGASGGAIRRLGFIQAQAAPVAGAPWMPNAYPPVVSMFHVGGTATVEDVMLRGIYRGVRSFASGRTRVVGLWGQVFATMIEVDKAYDVTWFDGIHQWPFWSSADSVIRYQQAHLDTFSFGRVDTPVIGRVFSFGARSVIRISQTAAEGPYAPGGTTTGLAADTLTCDFVQHCLWVDPSVTDGQATAQVGNLRSYSQVWNSSPAAPVAMLANSDVVGLDGAAILQIGNLEAFGSDTAILRATNPKLGSNVQVGSLFGHLGRMSAGAAIVRLAGPHNLVTIGMPPMLTPDAPPGFANSASDPGSQLRWPETVSR